MNEGDGGRWSEFARSRPARTALASNTHGAILVMGVFLCSCLVSVLWYLAGIGDAIIYRERLQEAADATAFSAAALSARGMNLIVLLNLIMACVLAVRVVMKGLQAGLVLAGVIFAIIPGAGGLASPCFTGAARMQQLINATRNPINYTLKGLSRAQKGMALVIPGAAVAGSVQVGLKYKPMVSQAAAASPHILKGLPVEEGSTERLCEEAAHSVSQLILLFAPPSVQGVFKSSFASKAEGLVDKAIAKGQIYFCEMGLGSPPDFGPEIETNAKEACDKKKTEAESAANQAGANYTTRCRGLGIPCDGTEASSNTLTPTQKAELANLRATRDAATQQVSGFDQDKCVKDKKAEAQKNLDANDPDNNTGTSQTKDPGGGANGNNAPSPSKDAKNPGKSPGKTPGKSGVSNADMTPKKVTPDFTNGGNRGQLVAVARGDDASLRRAPVVVRLASFRKSNNGGSIDPRANMAFAQAEFFFDCAGTWQGDDCNGKSKDGDAMWHLRWRPRLRLFNAPFGGSGSAGAEKTFDAAAHAQYVAEALQSTPSLASANAYKLLAEALKDTVILH